MTAIQDTSAPPAAPGPAKTSRRTWLFRFGALLVLPLLFFILLELALRLSGYGFPADFFIKVEGHDGYTGNDEFGLMFFDRNMLRKPALMYLPARKAPGTYRIFVLGGSAALGDPDIPFGFSRILEVMLRRRFPDIRFEVVNAAMIAINSHVVVPIARDCARREGDLFIIYLGNNEVVGPYGAGTIFGDLPPSLLSVRSGILIRSMRLGQLLDNLFKALFNRGTHRSRWGGLEMFLDKPVPADDPRMKKVYDYYRKNLEDICEAARSCRAGVIISTVATNLKDCAPFASMHRPGLTADQLRDWQKFYDAGVALESIERFAPALQKYSAAAKIDDRFADLQFRMARCNLALNQYAEARRRYILARDLDVLRFRADSRINEIIRQLARNKEPRGIYFADADAALAGADVSAHGIPGRELFHDHVHMNFEGNYLLARAVFEQVVRALPGLQAEPPAPDNLTVPSKEECAQALALTGWDYRRFALGTLDKISRAPFTNQLDNDLNRKELLKTLRRLNRYASPDGLRRTSSAYRSAIEKRPDDALLRFNYARLLTELGDYAGAAEQWTALLHLLPGRAEPHLQLGIALDAQGKLDEALAQFRAALKINPHYEEAYYSMGSLLIRRGNMGEAADCFRKALRLRPDYAEAHFSLGDLFTRQGNMEQAAAHYREALAAKPDYAEAHTNLGFVLDAIGRYEEAFAHFRQAVRLNPDIAEAHYNLGYALANRGHIRQAVSHYRKALSIRPNYSKAHLYLGNALAAQGSLDEAIEHYRQALRIEPGLEAARKNLEKALSEKKRK